MLDFKLHYYAQSTKVEKYEITRLAIYKFFKGAD